MFNRIIFCLSVLFSAFSLAQQSTSSPYSYFGIGETKFRGTPEQRAMSGLGILPDSLHINLLNPASYSTLSLTTISVSGGTTIDKMASDNQSATSQRTSLDYLAFGIPLGKFGTSFGLNPQTAVGYRNENTLQNENFTSVSQYIGDGGTNRVFLGGAYQIVPNFSIGFDLNYYFGNIKTESKIYLSNVQFSTGIFNELDLSGFGFNLGAMYKKRIKNRYEWYGSFSYNPSYTLDYTKKSTVASISQSQNNSELWDSQYDLPTERRNFKMPSKFSIGTGFGKLRKWFVGVEFSSSEKSEINTPVSGSFSNFENKEAMRFSLGGYYIPRYNSFTNYFQRVVYRAGIRYENIGLSINTQEITDQAISAGLSLPIGNYGLSDLTFAFEYGQKGTKSSGLIQENYFNINIGLTITDKWFRKYLYD